MLVTILLGYFLKTKYFIIYYYKEYEMFENWLTKI